MHARLKDADDGFPRAFFQAPDERVRGVAGDEESGVGGEEGKDGGEGVGCGFGRVVEVVDAGDAGGGGEVGVFGLGWGMLGVWMEFDSF